MGFLRPGREAQKKVKIQGLTFLLALFLSHGNANNENLDLE